MHSVINPVFIKTFALLLTTAFDRLSICSRIIPLQEGLQHENHKTHKRYISSVVAGLIVTAVTMTGFSYNDKTVTVMVDGAAHTVRTHLNSNEGIVRDAGVKLNPNDKVISSHLQFKWNNLNGLFVLFQFM